MANPAWEWLCTRDAERIVRVKVMAFLTDVHIPCSDVPATPRLVHAISSGLTHSVSVLSVCARSSFLLGKLSILVHDS